jgi:hypothetical protein
MEWVSQVKQGGNREIEESTYSTSSKREGFTEGELRAGTDQRKSSVFSISLQILPSPQKNTTISNGLRRSLIGRLLDKRTARRPETSSCMRTEETENLGDLVWRIFFHLERPRLFNVSVKNSLAEKGKVRERAGLITRFKPTTLSFLVTAWKGEKGEVEPYNTFRGGYRCNVFELTA